MGTPKEGFGYDAKEEGKKAAKDIRKGKITKQDVHDKYKKTKEDGQGEEFKEGYAEGSNG